MKLPGRAWLEFDVEPTADGAIVYQIAVFEPVGLTGLIYWYGLRPVHAVIFGGMLREIARRARQVTVPAPACLSQAIATGTPNTRRRGRVTSRTTSCARN
jgi:hypothetical protein